MKIEKIVEEAQLSLGPIQGRGLGAILRAIIVLIVIFFVQPDGTAIVEVVKIILGTY